MTGILSKFVNLATNPNPSRSQEAIDWFREQARRIRTLDPQKVLINSRENARARVLTGQMYMFSYDPKHKDKLPYYDRFPLVFPIKRVSDGMIGLNMHYLPLAYRAKLMDSLYSLLNNNEFNETTRLRITYDILNSSSKFRYFKPCIKHYLNSYMDSRFIYIPPEEWEIALFLPIHRFKNANVSEVYKESRRIILGQ
jgi:hypothetical protein